MRRRLLIGVLVVAAVSTLGDLGWAAFGIRHRTTAGLAHGAILLAAVGGVLGAAAGRLSAGLPLGALAGIAGALAYYGLRPVLGRTSMLAAWAVVWIVLAILDGAILRRAERTATEVAVRGLLAALLSGLAFAAVVEPLWGAGASGRSALVRFALWAAAWAPGLLALGWPVRARVKPG